MRQVAQPAVATSRFAHPLVRSALLRVATSYLLLILVFLWPSVVRGAVPLPLMNAYAQDDPAWSGFSPPDMAAGANPLLSDVSDFYYPYAVFSANSLRAGHFPLWNPQIFGGMPYFAASQGALLYPINLLCFWLGPHAFWASAAILRMLLAGVGTFLLARKLGASVLGAWLSGGIYLFAAFNVVWLHFGIHNVAALLPLALWLLALLIERPRRRTFAGLAALTAAQMFGGHPETSLSFLLVCAGFTLALTLGRRGWLRANALAALALALGLALAAVQWMPTLQMVRASAVAALRATIVERSDAVGNDYSPLGGVRHASWGNVRHWLLLVQPTLWGDPRGELVGTGHAARMRWWLVDANYNEMTCYVGLATLPLALWGALRGRNRPACRFFAALFALGLALMYALPGFVRLGYLPGISAAHGLRPGLWITLAAALLSGWSLTWLARAPRWALLLTVAMLGALVLASGAVTYDLWGGQRVAWALGFTPSPQTRALIADLYRPANGRVLLPALAGLLAGTLCLYGARRPAARHDVVRLVAGVVVLELLVWGYGYNGFTPPAYAYPATKASRWLRAQPGPFRIINPDGAFGANKAMTQGIEIATGVDDLLERRHQQFVARGEAAFPWIKRRVIVRPDGQRLMDLMNVRYLVTRQSTANSDSGPTLPLLLKDGNVRVYDNISALPRAFSATTARVVAPDAAIDAAFDPRFDPHRAVLLEQAVPGIPPGEQRIAAVPVVAYAPNEVELAPTLAAPAIVVLVDSYDADWRVTVDGQERALLRANGVFRGVAVEAGAHRVLFRYWPRWVIRGGIISLAALAALMLAPRGRELSSCHHTGS